MNIYNLPDEILSAIEADVERYRNMRIQVAIRRNQPEYLDKLARKKEWNFVKNETDQIVRWFADGLSIDEIAAKFRFVKKTRIKHDIDMWIDDELNKDRTYQDGWLRAPRFNEEVWRNEVNRLIKASGL